MGLTKCGKILDQPSNINSTEILNVPLLKKKPPVARLSKTSSPTLGPTHPPIQWAIQSALTGVIRPGSEHRPNCSLPSSAEAKNAWCYASISTYAFASCAETTSPLPLALYTDALHRLLGRDMQNSAEILNVLDERGNTRSWPAAGHEKI